MIENNPALPDLNPVHLTEITLASGTVLHRIHRNPYRAPQFNASGEGNARFSPVRDSDGQIIPTLYAGTSFDCAAMETVFHDVPCIPGFKTYPKERLAGHRHAKVRMTETLRLIDLSSKALRRLGITRAQLIDTEKDRYPHTRRWAEWVHAQSDAQGLRWVSRQDDTAIAIVLFGDRVKADVVVEEGEGRCLLDSESAYAEILALADKIGVLVIPGHG